MELPLTLPPQNNVHTILQVLVHRTAFGACDLIIYMHATVLLFSPTLIFNLFASPKMISTLLTVVLPLEIVFCGYYEILHATSAFLLS